MLSLKETILPIEWKWVKLSEICEVVTGTTPPKSDMANYGDNVPFFKPPHLWDGLISETEEMLSLKGATKARIVPPNTVLVTCIGNLGRTGFVRREAAFNQQINAILENEKIDGKYIFYQAQSPTFRNQLEKLATGTTVSIVNKGNFETIKIPLPPLATQQLIVSKIEELFSELDKGIADLKTAQQQLKTYRQSVLKWAFEGKLTNKKVKDGELPKGWEWTTFEKVCNKIGDIDHKMPKQLEKGYPYVSTKDFTNDFKISFENAKYISKEDYLNLSRKIKPEKGDIIFPRYGTIGKNILIDFDKEFLVSYSCAVVKPNHNLILSKYIYLYSLSPKITDEIRKYVVETTQANIGIASIKSFLFPFPPFEEQNLIVQEIESRLSVADKMEESITQSLQQAEALRQSILKKAFKGKLVTAVAEQREVKVIPLYKPKNEYFYQMQLLGIIAKASKQKQIEHGEMTLAKYAYLMDKVYDIPTYYEYNRWHLGPYPPIIKKAINNKQYFKKSGNYIEVLNEKALFKSTNPNTEKTQSAVNDLIDIFSKYPAKERSYKTELLATVCKVIEDIQSTDLKAVRQSMQEWKIDLKGEKHKTKAEKFNEPETEKCLAFIKEKCWDKKLIK